MATPLFSIPEIQENQSGKYITHNEALALLEALVSRVLSRTNSGPPGSPSEGDTYIVDNNDSDTDWAKADIDDIAHYYDGTWHFLSPVQGLDLYCVDEAIRIYYDGSEWLKYYASRLNTNVSLNDQDAAGVVDYFTVDSNSVGFGCGFYVNSSGNMEEAKATGQATMPCMALALETGTGSGKQVLFWGRIRNDAWNFGVGNYLYINTSTGILSDTKPENSGEIVQVVGIALASNLIFFNPSYVTIEIS